MILGTEEKIMMALSYLQLKKFRKFREEIRK